MKIDFIIMKPRSQVIVIYCQEKTSITTRNQPPTFYFNKATHDYANHFNY